MHIFTLLDTCTKKPGKVFLTENDEDALRQFQDVINMAEKGSLFFSHPEHFDLVKLGQFDEKKCEIISTEREVLANGSEVHNGGLVDLAAAPANV